MDAVRFLKLCHRKLNRLFKRSGRTDAFDRKKRIFKKLKKALEAGLPPIVVIIILFTGLFLMAVGLDEFANPRVRRQA